MRIRNGFVIACAWPETMCKQPGSWYDSLMNYLGISQDGYYKVGHAALILIDKNTANCEYYDFGRYHAPKGYGRVRSQHHDHELIMQTKAVISDGDLANLNDILEELYSNKSSHGTGSLFASHTEINYNQTKTKINQLIDQGFIKYGPFIPFGTNCSRFVNTAIRAGRPLLDAHVLLKIPFTVSPTPMWNLHAIQKEIRCIGESVINQEPSDIFIHEQAS